MCSTAVDGTLFVFDALAPPLLELGMNAYEISHRPTHELYPRGPDSNRLVWRRAS